MKVDIGFTGSRKGMTPYQGHALRAMLKTYGGWAQVSFHHGDCVGADEEAHEIALSLPNVVKRIIIHPPTDDRLRAFCKGDIVTILEPKPYLKRNRDIVDASGVTIGTPYEYKEELRSGTWATLRYAAKTKGSDRVLIYSPDGEHLSPKKIGLGSAVSGDVHETVY